MKKTILTLGLALMITSCGRQGGYTIKGDIEGLEGNVILSVLNEEGKSVAVDSAEVTDGGFTFNGSVGSPHMARLLIKGKRGPEFFIENSNIALTGKADSLRNLKISGSKHQEIVEGVNADLNIIMKQMEQLYQRYREAKANNNEDELVRIETQYEELNEQQNEIMKGAVTENSDNGVGPYFAYRRLRYSLSLDEMKTFASGFEKDAAINIYAKMLTDYIAVLETVAVGQIAPDFEMNDPDGNPVKLSSFRGKYLLIDFWASWCGPCRNENPNVVKLYKKVKGKDFDILGVSLDNSRENWLKGIKEDGLIWSHVSDVKGWDNRVAKLYGVSSIPHTVLLDKEGRIIEKNLRGEKLKEKVMELVQ